MKSGVDKVQSSWWMLGLWIQIPSEPVEVGAHLSPPPPPQLPEGSGFPFFGLSVSPSTLGKDKSSCVNDIHLLQDMESLLNCQPLFRILETQRSLQVWESQGVGGGLWPPFWKLCSHFQVCTGMCCKDDAPAGHLAAGQVCVSISFLQRRHSSSLRKWTCFTPEC